MPTEEAVAAPVYTHKNPLSELVYTRTYARWNAEAGRRETWPETVRRYFTFLETERPKLYADEAMAARMAEIEAAVLRMDVLPSMRALWTAGEAARRDNTGMYNCSFLPMDCFTALGELCYILMQGTGVGLSVEGRFVGCMPTIPERLRRGECMVIDDTAEGWADAIKALLYAAEAGRLLTFDYSRIRPEGAVLKTKGGRASGPEPLRAVLQFITNTLRRAKGRKLTTVEVADIACVIAHHVMAGGTRRSALIITSDLEDLGMRHYKDFSRGEVPAHRYNANISTFYDDKPDRETFEAEWQALVDSHSGERGIFAIPDGKRGERGTGDLRPNPCGEILLRYREALSEAIAPDTLGGRGRSGLPYSATFAFGGRPVFPAGVGGARMTYYHVMADVDGGGQFCNLTAAVTRASDTPTDLANKVAMASALGAIQASFTHFPYLRHDWKTHCEEDRLLGVDINGQCDNPALFAGDEGALFLYELNLTAQKHADDMADFLGQNRARAITTGKPSGNSSQLADCASGFHPRYAPYYRRRIQIAKTDPLCQMLLDQGCPMEEKRSDTTQMLAVFPVKTPEGGLTRYDETALQQCERYLKNMRYYMGERGHNQSATIYVRPEEWDGVREWVWEHWSEVCGLSFLPFAAGGYEQTPYEEITAEEYAALTAAFPVLDYTQLARYESEDYTTGAKEYACAGGACEL